jgi:hypothetical protein
MLIVALTRIRNQWAPGVSTFNRHSGRPFLQLLQVHTRGCVNNWGLIHFACSIPRLAVLSYLELRESPGDVDYPMMGDPR